MPRRAPKHRPYSLGCAAYQPPQRDRQAERALATNSTPWRRLRALVLAACPLCVACSAEGRIRAASHVDHRDGDSRNNELSNLQGLCVRCHSAKTAREDGGFGNKRGKVGVPKMER
ncbi:HNH endonuclease signature motif containing protein [Stenotrophomonas indicatrix]|uniref:HNH endonuclease signature motif containing protein n=1 Tax=Stenotrophomonas indicatrix TaxID=2045451 RepID=UPI001CBEE006|nr:HNH endonuclease signature motif containing protein [Stenotrophomonas indicatrix]